MNQIDYRAAWDTLYLRMKGIMLNGAPAMQILAENITLIMDKIIMEQSKAGKTDEKK